MRKLQRFVPQPRHREIGRIFVRADPARTWQAARHFDGATIPWVRILFDLRDLPNRVLGKPVETDRRLGVDQVAESGQGFMLLDEVDSEVVVGAVGQFWHREIPFASVEPAEFRAFAAPGWGKLAWAIRVEPFGKGSTVSFELRTTATDEPSWRKLRRYYRLIGRASRLIRWSVLARLQAELGELRRPDDATRPLPADDRLPHAKYQLTHAIDIEAPRSVVWRYLMQLGCDRGGWYSFDALDHGGEPSEERLSDAWTTRVVGDRLAATPAKDSFYDVLEVDPERAFVIGGTTQRLGGPFSMTWAFVLDDLGDDATHLTVRARMESSPKWAEWLMGAVMFPPVHALMQRRQLRNLKRHSERVADARGV